jgi:uracil-DNA glycosylase
VTTENSQALTQVYNQMRVCRLCVAEGYDVIPKAIFTGNFGAKIMTVGQAPGITEVEAGRPFNAGSGKRLFQWLWEAGIDEDWFRSTQYMTSVTKCYPGRSRSGSGDRVPSPAEQRLCRPYLDQEIALADPALIIPIGKLAIEIFYPKGLKLTEIIGTQTQIQAPSTSLRTGRWVVPLPHSSGASRWHQIESNRALIQKAIGLIAWHYRRLFPSKQS